MNTWEITYRRLDLIQCSAPLSMYNCRKLIMLPSSNSNAIGGPSGQNMAVTAVE